MKNITKNQKNILLIFCLLFLVVFGFTDKVKAFDWITDFSSADWDKNVLTDKTQVERDYAVLLNGWNPSNLWWGTSGGVSMSLNAPGKIFSVRFTAPATRNVSSVGVVSYGASDSPIYKIGLQLDDGNGNPNGIYINGQYGTIQPVDDNTIYSSSFSNNVTIVKGQVYYVVVKYDSGTIDISHFSGFKGMTNGQGASGWMPSYNYNGYDPDIAYEDPNYNNRCYDGSYWYTNNRNSANFILNFDNGEQFGALELHNYWGVLGTTVRGERILIHNQNKTVDQIKSYFWHESTTGLAPNDDLYYEIQDSSHIVLRSGVLIDRNEFITKKPTQWWTANLSSPLTLEVGRAYYVIFKSPGSNGTSYYDHDGSGPIYHPDWTIDLTYGGGDSYGVESLNGGTTWNETKKKNDYSFGLKLVDTLTGDLTSVSKDAEIVGGVGDIWKKIKYEGNIPAGTSVDLAINSSTCNGFVTVKENATSDQSYDLPACAQKKDASWKATLKTNDTSVTSQIYKVSLVGGVLDSYVLAVTNGTGSGSYAQNQSITIIANAPQTGKVFDRWTGNTSYMSNAGSSSTTVTMPSQAINLTATYRDIDTAATPAFSPAAGTYTSTQTVAITSATNGATIYYTTNGNTPTASSTLYAGAITISSTTTLKAIAVKAGSSNSSIASATYTITPTTTGTTGGGGTATITPTITKVEIIKTEGNILTLSLNVQNATQMMLSESSSFLGSVWETYSSTKTYTKQLTQTKLYLKFKSSTDTVSSIVELVIPATITNPSSGGDTNPYPTGTLLKLSDSFKVYVIIEGKKKWIPTPEVFQQLGYKWTNILTVTPTQLNTFPDYEDNLIRAINDYKVYLVVNGVKRHIPNPIIFLDYGFKWNEVKDVPKETIDKYKNTYLIKQSNTNGIYYVNPQEIRKLIPSTEVFNSYNDKQEDIQIISKTEMDFYPLSNLIKLNGSNDIYLIEGNIKKRIPNPQVFNKYKLNWNLVMSVNQTEFNFYSDGGELK